MPRIASFRFGTLNRRRAAAALCLGLGLSLGLSGCGVDNRSVESVHQPVVQRTDYTLDIAVSDGLSEAEAKQVSAWLNGLEPGYSDTISIDASFAVLPQQTAVQLAELVAQYGLKISSPPPVTQGRALPGDVRIILSRQSAQVPGCPDWRRPSYATGAGQTLSNYGCATNGNFAQMIADPSDLLSGRKDKSADPNPTSSNAIKAFSAGSAAKSQVSPASTAGPK